MSENMGSSDIPEYGTPGAEGSADPAGTAGRPEAKQAWSDAGERLGGLGAKLKAHYESQSSEGNAGGAELKEAARKLGEAVEHAFHTIGVAAKDKSVQEDVKKVGRSVADALAGTFAGLSDEMKKTFGKQGAATGPATEPTTGTTGATGSTDPTTGSAESSGETPPPSAPSNPPTGPDVPPPGSTS